MKTAYIINTITSWNEPPRARHQLAQALSKHFEVVFVSSNEFGLPKSKLVWENKNYQFYIPQFPIDPRIRIRIPLLNLLYQKWLFKRLKKEYPNHIVINFDFTAKYVSRYFTNNIYYCNDDHVGISKRINNSIIANYHHNCEKSVAENARFCVSTSIFLKKKLQGYNPNSFEIRLAAPNIQNVSKYKYREKGKVINIGIVGYFKTIDSNILELLYNNEDLHFTLVGPISKKLKEKYETKGNVKITGSLIGEKLYDEVSKFDVGLVPYDLNAKVERTPNKLWLYLALGKPVVISNIKGIINWKFPERFVYRSNSNIDFLELIQLANLEDSEELYMNRIKFAKQNSWDIRVNELLSIFSDQKTSSVAI